MRWMLLTWLMLPMVAEAAIYKCVIEGRPTYQSQPCPPDAEKAKDVSHLEASEPDYEQSVPAGRVYRDYREETSRQRLQRLRQQEKYEAELARERAREDARRQLEMDRRQKAARDRRWQEEQIRRKARNNDDYEYIEINVR